MRLSELLVAMDVRETKGAGDPEVRGIAYHSQRVREGDVFVAVKGAASDGHHFIHEAVKRGASAVIAEKRPAEPTVVPIVVTADTRKALAQISAEFFGHPSREITLVGITGTNGKTTTSFLLESIFKEAGKKVGVIGTINYRFGHEKLTAPTTTPQSYDLQQLLRTMVEKGIEYGVMEVSSHALDQERVAACHFDVGVFTNLSPEHLDYHEDMQQYFAAKKRFFHDTLAQTQKDPYAVVNVDDPLLRDFIGELTALKTMTYGLEDGDVKTVRREVSLRGIDALLCTSAGTCPIRSRLIGEYNLYNIMAAVAVGVALHIPLDTVRRGIEGVTTVAGRMEQVGNGNPLILVDYAHTPDALEKAIQGLRKLVHGKLLLVFGCGGDRDRSKRPVMGRIGVQLADLAIITSDNPRTEDPLKIIEEIEQGAQKVDPHRYLVIPDRREAIKRAITLAASEDAVLVAGKGHEDYQVLGREKVHFDDREEARKALEARKAET